MEQLELGVIRDERYYRANDVARARHDAEYSARRPQAMAAGRYRCVFCAHMSQRHNECHHRDGDHANNTPENYAVVDPLCHGYHHLGQRSSRERFAADNLGARSVIAAVPEIDAADLNLLQRAIGVALLDEGEAGVAQDLMKRLALRSAPVQEAFGTYMPGDFAAAMVKLDDQQYQHRGAVIGTLRLLFNTEVLRDQGEKFLKDFPALPVKTWDGIAQDAGRTDTHAHAAR